MNLPLAELIGRRHVIGRELAHGPDVDAMALGSQPGQFEVFEHSFSQFGHESSLSCPVAEILQRHPPETQTYYTTGQAASECSKTAQSRETHPNAAQPLRRVPSMFDSLGVKVPYPT